MAYKIIRPRHGIKSLWNRYKSRIYKLGEMLVESPESGVGSGLVNIKFGDGVTDYEKLPYAVLAPVNEVSEGVNNPPTADAVRKAIDSATPEIDIPDDLLSQSDVVDNLESDRTDLPPSARTVKILNENMGGLKLGLNGEGIPGYFMPDGTFKPFTVISTFNEFISNVSYSHTSNTYEKQLEFNGACKFNEELVSLSSNKGFVTINKAGKYRVTIDAKVFSTGATGSSCYLKKNGTMILGKVLSNSGTEGGKAFGSFSGEFSFAQGDTLTFFAQSVAWGGTTTGVNAGSELCLDYLG